MKFYKDKNNQVFAFEPNGSQDAYITDNLVPMTEQEVYDHLNPVIEPTISTVVSRAQARKALAIQGLLSLVQPAIDSITDPLQRTLAQIDWDDAQVFERNNQTLVMLAASLGLTEQQLDELFSLAATL